MSTGNIRINLHRVYSEVDDRPIGLRAVLSGLEVGVMFHTTEEQAEINSPLWRDIEMTLNSACERAYRNGVESQQRVMREAMGLR